MDLNQYLTQLGSTSEEVAASLRQQGVKGLKRSYCMCPILNAIYRAVPDYWPGLKILGGGKSQAGTPLTYYATLSDSQIVDPILPQPVLDFIQDFDDGQYPDLVAQKVETKPVRSWT